MPNWCSNVVDLYHDDPKMIERFRAAFMDGRALNEFIPVPQALRDTVAGWVPEGYERELHEFTQALNRKHFGYADWYDFCVAKWGTKWDIGGPDGMVTGGENQLMVEFDSAWSPPIAAYEKLMALGFDIQAYYYEPGCNFAGMFAEGDDCCYNLPETWTDAKRLLPYALIEIFNLEEHYSMDEEHEMEMRADQVVAEEREREAFAKTA
jgi:hypothetical protein